MDGDYLFYVAWAMILAGIVLIYWGVTGAVELSIIGSSIGQGAHIVSFTGDQLNASIIQGLNSSSWNVTAVVPA